MTLAPRVTFENVTEDGHYEASVALDDVLGWFLDDGFTRHDILTLVDERLDTLTEDDAS